MKTFETEKHNIPKGATHYIDETCVHRFSWGKYIGDDLHLRLPGDIEWTNVENKFFSGVVVEIKKPRTKTEFVKCEFEQVYLAAKAVFDGEDLFVGFVDHSGEPTGEYSVAVDQQRAARNYQHLYRKVETEIDERQEFIDAYASLRHEFHGQRTYDDFSGFMYDSGKFKLVEK